MGRSYDTLTPGVIDFITEQHVFFVATAPSEGGHVNLSPKGLDTFRVVDGHRVAYLDLTGSGIETVAHLRQNGRITLMFCAFTGPPRIVRLQGTGTASILGEADFEGQAERFPPRRGARAVVTVELDRIADSCGYSVPLYAYVGDRDVLDKWVDRRSDAELNEYRMTRNAVSIDGVPAWPAD